MKETNVRKIITALMTCILSTSMLYGCGSENQTKSNSSGVTNTTEAPNTKDADNGSLPFTNEKVTLTMWAPMDGNFATTSGDYNDNEFFKELERRTGIHINFRTPATGEELSNFNLMIASGELADIIIRSDQFSEGLDTAVEDKYYLDLSPYMDTYLADYQKRRSISEDIIKATTTDNGRIAAVYGIYIEEQGPWAGMQVRKDWLDDLGLDIPVTYDDWEVMLTGFKNQKNAYAPLSLGRDGYMILNHATSAGYGAMFDFMNVNGTVQYGPITDGWRKYVTTMADWYAKGLIDPDYMTSGAFFVDTEKVVSGQSGAWMSMYTMPSLYEKSSADKNMHIIPVTPPVPNKGDDVHIRIQNRSINIATSVSADTKYPELCMQWINYLFTDEGALLANYGIEGISFAYDADGKPNFNDTITANPEGLSMSQAQAKYTCPPSLLSVYYDWTRELVVVPEKDLLSYDVWGSSYDDYMLPTTLSLTSDESKERASFYSDIQTFANESTNQFITGYKDIETGWDDYVNTIKSMNIDRCIDIMQAALDRYNAR